MISLGKIGTPRSRSRWEMALLLKVTKIFLQNGRSISALFSTMIMVKSHLICHNQLRRTCQSTTTHLHLSVGGWKPFAKWRWTRQQDLTVLLPQKLFRWQWCNGRCYPLFLCWSVLKSDTTDQWITSVIVPLPKKGDLSLMTNYRGISLLSIAAKVYNKILLNRIRDEVDPTLRKNQAGFRQGRSCAQQIHILRRVLEGLRDYQLPLVVTFIDFKKAFDSINRKVMFAVPRHYGIPEAVVNAISVLYENSKSAVMVDGGLSDPFEVTTGVLQGDVLAPFLFVVLVDYLLKKATTQLDSGAVTHPRRSRRHPAKSLNDLDFADDIALLESSISRAQAQLTKTAEAAADLGLVTKDRVYDCSLSQPFKSMEIQSTMYQILDTLVPWWHLAQVTSKGESHLLGVHSGSWNNFGRVHTYPSQQKLSCLILFVSLYYSMAVNRGWSPRMWKTKSMPLLPHATESCWI